MKKTAKSRSTESSAAAERLADYKGDLGVGCAGEDHGGGGIGSSGGGGGGGGNSVSATVCGSATANSGCLGGSTGQQSPAPKESTGNTPVTNQHTPPSTAIRDLSIRGMKEKKPSTSSLGSGDKVVRVLVDDSKPKPTTKKNKPIQADLDVSKEFSRYILPELLLFISDGERKEFTLIFLASFGSHEEGQRVRVVAVPPFAIHLT
ncbi:hypothetical protein SK128_018567 [Halocaridina rubra]|uniref:Uncharacterized protein n=1 Tax=Halocaridina rubra TaxID=373956 RepID=A0AAN8ZT00_HALRR